MKYVSEKGQTIIDITVQNYGDLDKIGEVIRAANQVVGAIPTRTELLLSNIDENATTEFFRTKRKIATFKNDY